MIDFFKRILIYGLFLFFAGTSVFSFSLYMPDDPEVKELVFLYTEAGMIFPDASFPVSLADLYAYAVNLRRLMENREIRVDIRRYIKELNYKKEHVFKRTDTSLKTAVFLNGDVHNPQDQGITMEQNRYPNDFYNRFVAFPDFGYLGLSAGIQGKSGISISIGLKREYHSDTVPDTNLFISTSKDPAKFENYFVREGYLAWKTDAFEFRIGRTPVHYGDARFSTFLPSDKLPWLDTFTYRYKAGPLTMTSYFGTIDSRMTEDEERIFIDEGTALPTEFGDVTFTTDPVRDPVLNLGGTPTGYGFRDTLILNSMHRFVLGWDKLRLGFSSSIVVARENNAIQIGDIFPVLIWHNAVLGSNNMNLVFDAGYAPFPGLALYGQAAWDDINASDIFGIPDSSVPTIDAYLFGVSYVPHQLKDMLNLSMRVETGITHYLWGNYYAYHDWKGSYLSRAIYRYHAQKGYYWMPLTSPYGPGTWWIDGETSIRPVKDFNLTAGFTYLRFNSDVNLFTTPYAYDPSLEGYNSTSFSVYLKSIYTYQLNSSNDLVFSFTPFWYSYKGHGWPEVEISVELRGKRIKDFNR